MAKTRVYELAKELGLDNKEIMGTETLFLPGTRAPEKNRFAQERVGPAVPGDLG